MKRVYVILAVILLSGCATAYQPKSFSGGFTETQMSENIFQINFRGNGYTSSERSEDFALLRCAEVTLEKGYNYFALIDSKTDKKTSFHQTPVTAQTNGSINTFGNTGYYNSTTTLSGGDVRTITKPKSSNLIMLFKDKPEGAFAFDAAFLKNSLRSKYGLDEKI